MHPCAVTLNTCCRCQSRCSQSNLYYHKRRDNLPQTKVETNVLTSKIRELQLKKLKKGPLFFAILNIYLVKFILWRCQALFCLCSFLDMVWPFFEIFQKFFFSLLAKTLELLLDKKLDGYSKHCSLGDSSSDSHSFWNTLYL